MKTYSLRAVAVAAACFLLVSLGAISAQAQTLPFDQAVACGSGEDYYHWGPTQLAVDAQGNRYAAGTYNGTITLGPSTLSATQTDPNYLFPSDNFVAKLTAVGTYLWAAQMGDAQAASISNIAVDGAGDVYVTGGFSSYSIRFGGATGPVLYNSSAQNEGFIAKLNGNTGQWLWARRIGGTGSDGLGTMVQNRRGNLYVLGGSGSATADVGPFILTGAQSFIGEISSTGIWLSVRKVGGSNVGVNSIALDPQGDIYLAGSFRSPSATFGATTLTTQNIVGSPTGIGYDLFVARMTEQGSWVWAVQGDAVTHQNLASASASFDGKGHAYLSGSYASTSMRIGTTILPNLSAQYPQPNPLPPTPYTNNYMTDAFVARLDLTTLTWDWAIRNGGPGQENAGQKVIDPQGRLYVLGGFSSLTPGGAAGNFAQLDGATGTWRSLQSLVYPTTSLAMDNASQPLLTGYFDTPTAQFGTTTLARVGTGSTGYIARLGAGPLAAGSAAAPGVGLQVWPNPSAGQGVWVQGVAAGQAVEVLDVLGRVVGRGRMPASGPLWLAGVAGLTPGVYVVRGGGQAQRLIIER